MKTLAQIQEEWVDCHRCPLAEGRHRMVFGAGPAHAELLFVGEGPGREEDLQGVPFVGDSGQLFNALLEEAGIDRRGVFVTNVVACRPPNNRKPNTGEIAACKPRLEEIIYTVDPILIVALGAVALKTLTGKTNPTSVRGMVFTTKIEAKLLPQPVVYPVLATLHPAFLLRNPERGPDGWVAKTLEDLRLAARIVAKVQEL